MRHYLVAEGANMDPRQAIDAMEDAVNDAISDKYEPLGAAFSVVDPLPGGGRWFFFYQPMVRNEP